VQACPCSDSVAGSDRNFLTDSGFRFRKFILIGVILAKKLKEKYIQKKFLSTKCQPVLRIWDVYPGSRFFAHPGSKGQEGTGSRIRIRYAAQCKPKLVHAVNAAGSDTNFLADSGFRFRKFLLFLFTNKGKGDGTYDW
jgi:hypothetical protein